MENNKKKYDIIRVNINNWDPVWLLEYGAPDDEYDFEINDIFQNINLNMSVEKLQIYIYNLFFKMFGSGTKTKALDKEECKIIANKIINDIVKLK